MKTKHSLCLFFLILLSILLVVPGNSRADGATRTITIHAKRFAFYPAEITLKKGETVTLSLISDDVPHSLLIKEMNINSLMVKGHPTEINITPEKTGDFKGVCGHFCGAGHGTMKFIVHVTDH